MDGKTRTRTCLLLTALLAAPALAGAPAAAFLAQAEDPGADAATPNPCSDPLFRGLYCASAAAGSAACRAEAVILHGAINAKAGSASLSASFVSPKKTASSVVSSQLGVDVAEAECAVAANQAEGLYACATARASQFNVLSTVKGKLAEGTVCSYNTWGWGAIDVAGLSSPVFVPDPAGENTFLNVPLVGTITLNERYSEFSNGCRRDSGAAVHLRTHLGQDVFLGWVSTVACGIRATFSTYSNPTGFSGTKSTAQDLALILGPPGKPHPTGWVTFRLCDHKNGFVAGFGCSEGQGAWGGAPYSQAIWFSNVLKVGTDNDCATRDRFAWRAYYSGDKVYLPDQHTNPTTEAFELAEHC